MKHDIGIHMWQYNNFKQTAIMDIKFEDREQEKIVPEFVYADMSEEDKTFAVNVANEARSKDNNITCRLDFGGGK